MASIPLLRLSLPLHPPKPPKPLLLHPRHHVSHFSTPPSSSTKPKTTLIKSSYTTTPATDRLISAASYFLPLLNGIQYGRFLFQQYPLLAIPFQPLLPLISLYRTLPYASFISFFTLYLGVARNPSFSRFARFNALQALLLDVLLILPMLFQKIFTPGSTGIGIKVTVWTHNFVFLFLLSCFLYALAATVLGKTPYLPFLAQAASRQLDSS